MHKAQILDKKTRAMITFDAFKTSSEETEWHLRRLEKKVEMVKVQMSNLDKGIERFIKSLSEYTMLYKDIQNGYNSNSNS